MINRKFQAISQWAGSLRRKLDYSIAFNGRPHDEDIKELVTEVIKVMINAIQPNAAKQVNA